MLSSVAENVEETLSFPSINSVTLSKNCWKKQMHCQEVRKELKGFLS